MDGALDDPRTPFAQDFRRRHLQVTPTLDGVCSEFVDPLDLTETTQISKGYSSRGNDFKASGNSTDVPILCRVFIKNFLLKYYHFRTYFRGSVVVLSTDFFTIALYKARLG